MRKGTLLVFAVCLGIICTLLISGIAGWWSFGVLSVSPPAGENATTASAIHPTQTAVLADQDAGVIRFIIEGREAARLDAAGLHVRGNIDYGGTLKDSGPAGYDVSSAGMDGEEPR